MLQKHRRAYDTTLLDPDFLRAEVPDGPAPGIGHLDVEAGELDPGREGRRLRQRRLHRLRPPLHRLRPLLHRLRLLLHRLRLLLHRLRLPHRRGGRPARDREDGEETRPAAGQPAP